MYMSSGEYSPHITIVEAPTTAKRTVIVGFRGGRETIDLLRRVFDKLDETSGCISAEELWDGVLRYVMA